MKKKPVDPAPLPIEYSPTAALAQQHLSELLMAFGAGRSALPEKPNARQMARAIAGAPRDVQKYIVQRHKELSAALPVLDALMPRLRALQNQTVLISAKDFAKERAALVTDWNAHIRAKRCTTLAPLCEQCGTPVFRRGDTQQPSLVCSDICKKLRDDRVGAVKRRKAT